jgi:hypothetical protein
LLLTQPLFSLISLILLKNAMEAIAMLLETHFGALEPHEPWFKSWLCHSLLVMTMGKSFYFSEC